MNIPPYGAAAPARRDGPGLGALALAFVLWLGGTQAGAAPLPGYEYVSPLPGSHRVSPGNNIVLRRAGASRETALEPPTSPVRGSISGRHFGGWVLSDDTRTWVFTPAEPFAPGETVSVTLEDNAGVPGSAMSFEFHIASPVANPRSPRLPGISLEEVGQAPRTVAAPRVPASLARALTPQPCDTMPLAYIPAMVAYSDNPDPGFLFLTPFDLGVGGGGLLAIVDNFGVPVFSRNLSIGAIDFTRQPDGRLTFYAGIRQKYFVLDSSYVVVDSITTGNGYTTDGHELVQLANGHWLLMAYDPQTVDMSVVVPGGDPNATVTGLIVQELDAAQNVVFQWRSWDHFQITDMIEVSGRLLTNPSIDYVHGNAIEPDLDGNLLISSRHMNEITKIDRQTGDIIWRLGLNAKNNQFTIVNDVRGFAHQHDIRRLPNGNITLYDNGNFLSPIYSRAVEFALDEQNLIATQVWEFLQSPWNFGSATGSVRRRDNGATLIDWGLGAEDPKITDLHADGTKALELAFGDPQIFSYRARRLPWRTNLFVPDADSLDFGTVEVGSSNSLPLSIHNNSTSPVELTCFASSEGSVSVSESVPLSVPAGGDAPLNVVFAPTTIGPVDARLYLRSVHGSELIAQVVHVTGTVTAVGGVGGNGDPRNLWLTVQPNPGSGERILTFGLPAAGPVSLEIYDLNGRRVATPFIGVAAAGTNRVSWNASPGEIPVNSGLYFARLTTASGTRTSKLINLSR